MADNQAMSASSSQDDGHNPSQSSQLSMEQVDEETVTMLDVLEEEQELEENAFAVLGGSDDKNCTYLRGHVARQALYACATCDLIDDQPAGICLACTYSCHEGHQLFELYTKRNFRCDCGNSKFVNNKCKLFPKKEAINARNTYNDNFKGVYCICKRPYPDPDNDDDDEMIQCVACEDWFHGKHLGANCSVPDEFSEMICFNCMEKLPLLWHYYEQDKNDVVAEVVNVPTTDGVDSGIESSCDSAMSGSPFPVKQCKLAGVDWKSKIPNQIATTFWQTAWRQRLCKCSDCTAVYKEARCEFLTDEKDTVHYYEEQGKETGVKVSQYDKGISALKQMDHVKQIEAIQGYNELKEKLTEYLKKFAENGKVVREDDINEFFEQMKSRKRPKLVIPHHCR